MVYHAGLVRAVVMVLIIGIMVIGWALSARAFDWTSARPSECPKHRWCGCAASLKVFGQNKPELWRARNWLKLGRSVSKPSPGVIVVYARGNGGGHIGLVTGVTGSNSIIVWSGNDNGAIRERERSTRGVLGYRQL